MLKKYNRLVCFALAFAMLISIFPMLTANSAAIPPIRLENIINNGNGSYSYTIISDVPKNYDIYVEADGVRQQIGWGMWGTPGGDTHIWWGSFPAGAKLVWTITNTGSGVDIWRSDWGLPTTIDGIITAENSFVRIDEMLDFNFQNKTGAGFTALVSITDEDDALLHSATVAVSESFNETIISFSPMAGFGLVGKEILVAVEPADDSLDDFEGTIYLSEPVLIRKGFQTEFDLVFTPPADNGEYPQTIELSTSGGTTGGTVIFENKTTTEGLAELTDNMLTIYHEGVISIKATIAGDDDYRRVSATATITLLEAPIITAEPTVMPTAVSPTVAPTTRPIVSPTERPEATAPPIITLTEGTPNPNATATPVVTAPSPTPIFLDVSNQWFAESVNNMAKEGFVNGYKYPEGSYFYPNNNITRAEFVKIIASISGDELNGTDVKFKDIADQWHAKYIAWAEKNDIVLGYDDGEFKPDKLISREEIAVIIDRFIEYAKYALTAGTAKNFIDEGQVSAWAKEAMQKMIVYGIIQGDDEGKLNPLNNSTRAEATIMLYRLFTKIEK
ncbi:MAG: S-layer homology domain-containing protein [Oscillospiraceae bacterium]|nr:S-layer homology domain-containing protein [Oscillospiraceae bacterium]